MMHFVKCMNLCQCVCVYNKIRRIDKEIIRMNTETLLRVLYKCECKQECLMDVLNKCDCVEECYYMYF